MLAGYITMAQSTMSVINVKETLQVVFCVCRDKYLGSKPQLHIYLHTIRKIIIICGIVYREIKNTLF